MKLTFTLLLFLILGKTSFCESKGDPVVQKKIKTIFSDKPFQQQVVTLMEKEMKRHNASAEDYARVVDSILFSQGKMQTYGTHLEVGKSGRLQAKPIQDPQGVDARRKAIGLPSMKDYLKEAQENLN